MINDDNFDHFFKSLERELEALKTARIKSAQTLNVHEWQGQGNLIIQNWMPQNSLKITITPTSQTSPNILSSVQGSLEDYQLRVNRTFESDSTVYYLNWLSHTNWEDDQENEIISIDVVVRYTAPADITIESVPYIYDIY